MSDMLVVQDVSRGFGTGEARVEALRGVSLTAAAGELLAVRGRSGSGKTTLLNVVGGLDRPDAGRVVLDGADVTAMDDDGLLALRRGTVSYVFQSFGLVPILTARENVGVPLRLLEVDPAEREERVAEALEHVGLSGHVNQRPGELSGGQQQRVAIARALVARPRVLLADEPTGQLDSETGREIMTLIARLASEQRMTTLVTTHDPALLSIADRVLEMADGHLAPAAG
ncbi:ABC transporter ATP-binding protein [Phycicoccus duodecadis]|uniref:Putative ABC transport system ATP-binding protein n=1 Tax=Phycicoccus duodecadis TaxID=173053 RepID=A0A2N3YMI1_9MICO|nr:ABC transporter ATP-binding protein [Phycicoccus duodecadis]PKW28008.1 putative ABC transport system ATP-binding protein [Phycicoccus duodecadis]